MGIVRLVKKSKHDKLPIIIGYDRRFLSRDAMMWIAEVLANNKIKVICTNRSVPTPLVMHYVKKHNLYYGIEITASHNPAKYNGIKLIIEEGRDASVEVTDELEN